MQNAVQERQVPRRDDEGVVVVRGGVGRIRGAGAVARGFAFGMVTNAGFTAACFCRCCCGALWPVSIDSRATPGAPAQPAQRGRSTQPSHRRVPQTLLHRFMNKSYINYAPTRCSARRTLPLE